MILQISYLKHLSKCAVIELEGLIKATTCIQNHAFQQTTKVSIVKHLICAYHAVHKKRQADELHNHGGQRRL